MNRKKKTVLKIILLIIFLTAYPVWYKVKYSMESVYPYEINSSLLPTRVLIATQGSAYKDSLVRELTNRLKLQNLYINVVDVSVLSNIKEQEWSAIVILHTWEYGKPPEVVRKFIKHSSNPSRLIVLCTSGNGKSMIPEVDGITSASQSENLMGDVEKINTRIQALVASAGQKGKQKS